MNKNKTIKKIQIPEKIIGKPFGKKELKLIIEEIKIAQPLTRAEIARRVCKRLNWKNAGGKYQEMSTKVALLRLHRAKLIKLPPPLQINGNGKKIKLRKIEMPLPIPIIMPVDKLQNLKLFRVKGKKASALYNALIERYHYLGYKPMAGAQIRYFIKCKEGLLGVIGFGASAWKISPRDKFIGWEVFIREKNLHLIVNNSRFLILPWIRSANLASKILSLCARKIQNDFLSLYGYYPVLLETFVEKERFKGHCYRAANWICVGQTQGRGKKHIYKTQGVPIKDIWLYPLQRNFKKILMGVPDDKKMD